MQNQKKFNQHVTDIIKFFVKSHMETFDKENLRDIVDSLYYEKKKQHDNVHGDSNINENIQRISKTGKLLTGA